MADVTVNDAVGITEFEAEHISPYAEANSPSVASKRIPVNATYAIPFAANLRSDNISGCKQIKAAPGSGSRLLISQILISSESALIITVGEGVADSGVTTALIGPVVFAAGQSIKWKFKQPLILTANTALVCDANTSGTVNIFVEGITV